MEGDVGPWWEVEDDTDLLQHIHLEHGVLGLESFSQLYLQSHLWSCCMRAAEERQEEEEVYPRLHGGYLTPRMADEMMWLLFTLGPQHQCWGH